MKVASFLPIAMAFTAMAEMQLYAHPTPVRRDIAAVSSVVSQISSALTQLDTSVKAFDNDASQVKSDAKNLVTVIKDGASTIVSSGAISLNDVLGLQSTVTSLATAGGNLLTDLESKKAAFEKAGLCDSVQSIIKSIGAEVQGFADSIVKQLPQEAQQVAGQFVGSISETLTSGAATFGASHCKNHGSGGSGGGSSSSDASSSSTASFSSSSSSSSAASGATSIVAVPDTYPTSTIATAVVTTSVLTLSSIEVVQTSAAAAVTVTVTAPCACESSTSVSIPFITLTPTISVPYPTGASNMTNVLPTGGAAVTTSSMIIATAGARSNSVGVVGLAAGLAAALLV